tara:strand:+ start:1708 stop:1932 length:225 start_codon:yes stop_codon:yes gene_type:complete
MSSKKLNYYHRGYVYKSKIKITDNGDIEFIHDISKRDNPDNVVFFYYGINSRPLKEIEFKTHVDNMIKITERSY